ncbi:MAG: DUF2523 family protein [Rhodocyclaceae bacterium]|uniref:DUF2523 family protein n=1 Tax=Uliginosibacterium sp. sgz301328 TaxID=3243764 RepID=UPI00359EB0A2
MSLASFIAAGVGPWVKRALVSVGMGVISYAGFSVIKSQLDSAIANMWGGVPATVYQVIALAGFVDAVGVWLGAITAAVSLLTFKKLGMMQA